MSNIRRALAAVVLVLGPGLLGACSGGGPVEAHSLSGEALRRPKLDKEVRAEREAALAEAERRAEKTPDDVDAAVWVGRRLAYLDRYNDAIEWYTRALERFPDSPRLLRHRGHRYITVRRFEDAAADLKRAAFLIYRSGEPDRIEADGLPNRLNTPRSTLHTNIFYHLALAEYLNGDIELAARNWRTCLDMAPNDDMVVASTYWLTLSLKRLDRDDEADKLLSRITQRMDIVENDSYHELLLMFKGWKSPADVLAGVEPGSMEFATRGFGVGAWHLVNGRPDEADAMFEQVVASRRTWPTFGHVAAEVELAR